MAVLWPDILQLFQTLCILLTTRTTTTMKLIPIIILALTTAVRARVVHFSHSTASSSSTAVSTSTSTSTSITNAETTSATKPLSAKISEVVSKMLEGSGVTYEELVADKAAVLDAPWDGWEDVEEEEEDQTQLADDDVADALPEDAPQPSDQQQQPQRVGRRMVLPTDFVVPTPPGFFIPSNDTSGVTFISVPLAKREAVWHRKHFTNSSEHADHKKAHGDKKKHHHHHHRGGHRSGRHRKDFKNGWKVTSHGISRITQGYPEVERFGLNKPPVQFGYPPAEEKAPAASGTKAAHRG